MQLEIHHTLFNHVKRVMPPKTKRQAASYTNKQRQKLEFLKRIKAKTKIISKNETFSTTSQLKLKLKLHLNRCEIPYIISVY